MPHHPMIIPNKLIPVRKDQMVSYKSEINLIITFENAITQESCAACIFPIKADPVALIRCPDPP